MKYVWMAWKFYLTKLAATLDHINRVSNFVAFAIALICALLALYQRVYDSMTKDIKEVLQQMQNLTEVFFHTLRKLMTDKLEEEKTLRKLMRDKLEGEKVKKEEGGKTE